MRVYLHPGSVAVELNFGPRFKCKKITVLKFENYLVSPATCSMRIKHSRAEVFEAILNKIAETRLIQLQPNALQKSKVHQNWTRRRGVAVLMVQSGIHQKYIPGETEVSAVVNKNMRLFFFIFDFQLNFLRLANYTPNPAIENKIGEAGRISGQKNCLKSKTVLTNKFLSIYNRDTHYNSVLFHEQDI